MGMNQVHPDFNDALEKYFRRTRIAAAAGRAIEVLENLRFRLFRGKRLTNERIVEYPMVFRLIRDQGRVLDVGCVSSRLPLQLASLGYEVHGVDLRPYPMTHPGFSFHRIDLLAQTIPFAPESFDVVTAVSCIEHFGLGAYGESEVTGGDRRFMAVLRTLLKKSGQLILTCPYGEGGVTPKHRIYDALTLVRLIEGFEVRREHYFRRSEDCWLPVTKGDLATVPSLSLPVNGVAVLDCVKA